MKCEYKTLQPYSLHSPSPPSSCAQGSSTHSSETCRVFLGVHAIARVFCLPIATSVHHSSCFFASSHLVILASFSPFPLKSLLWVISIPTLIAILNFDLMGSTCSVCLLHFSHALLELATPRKYSTSTSLCLSLLLSNLNLLPLLVPHQRFSLSNWVYELSRLCGLQTPTLVPYLSASSSFCFCLYPAYAPWSFTSITFANSLSFSPYSCHIHLKNDLYEAMVQFFVS